MASMRDIKRRKSSIQSTQQITKAMKLVSTVKLQRARQNAEDSADYFTCMYETVSSILKRTTGMQHPYLNGGTSGKKAVIVMTSNRGYTIEADASESAEEPVYPDAMALSDRLLKDFAEGKVCEIYLAYTKFKNTVSHIPTMLKLLPVEIKEEAAQESDHTLMNFEMDEETALDLLIPKYVTSLIYGGLVESVASENGARMQAMDSATSNAEEMIGDLTLLYNRARQGSITQELTEIIAGAEAIS